MVEYGRETRVRTAVGGSGWRQAARRAWLTASAVLLCSLPLPAPALAVFDSTAADDRFARVLEQQLAAAPADLDAAVPLFYQRREFQPAWDDPARIAELLSLIEHSADHGLDSRDFAPHLLRAAAAQLTDTVAARVERDLLFSASLARFVHQVLYGKLDPRQLYADWNYSLPPGAYERAQELERIVTAPALQAALAEQLPAPQQYRALQAALTHYRALAAAAPWPQLADGAVLRPGERSPRVAALRARLQAEAAVDPAMPALASADAARYDRELAEAVRRFQRRHGLRDDGEVGAQTVAVLNLPAQARVEQLRVNLERLRWMAKDLQGDRLEVDLTGYRAQLFLSGETAWSARVIVGKPARATPALLDSLQYLVLNPKWVVPPTILREDVLPRLASDPDYLARQRMRVLDRSGQVVDPAAVDWANEREARAAYQLQQDAGADGSLGLVKFALGNDYAIFLHDTNARRLFGRAQRALSSGCVRVENPLQLAQRLLEADAPGRWSEDALQRAVASGRTRTIALQHSLPVLLNYFTAVVDEAGELQFRADIYQRDKALLRALDRIRPEWRISSVRSPALH